MILSDAEIEAELKLRNPHGHPKFISMTLAEMKLHSAKNYDYAKGGDPLGNFRRVAAILALYPGLPLDDPAIIAMVYALKQLDAYLWMKCQHYEGGVEGIDSRLGDVHVYGKLARILDQERENVA